MAYKVSFLDRTYWTNNKYAWAYAILIVFLAVSFAVILKALDIYEGVALRNINIFFILAGFILLIRDYRIHSNQPLTYVQAFMLLMRTGIYFVCYSCLR